MRIRQESGNENTPPAYYNAERVHTRIGDSPE